MMRWDEGQKVYFCLEIRIEIIMLLALQLWFIYPPVSL
jgi:hypothetical protein